MKIKLESSSPNQVCYYGKTSQFHIRYQVCENDCPYNCWWHLKISIISILSRLISMAADILEYLKLPAEFPYRQFKTDYLQKADQAHLHLSFWRVFPGCQVSIWGTCFCSLAGTPHQAILHCWVSLKLCASTILISLVWKVRALLRFC